MSSSPTSPENDWATTASCYNKLFPLLNSRWEEEDIKEGQKKKRNRKKELIEGVSKKYMEVLKNLEKKVKDLNNQNVLES